jgi:hypothetical protein
MAKANSKFEETKNGADRKKIVPSCFVTALEFEKRQFQFWRKN